MEKRENLKPCPFCGVMPHIYWEAWKDISPDAGVWKLEANHKDSCYITHINGTNISGRSSARRLSQLVEWWNHREELFGNSEQLESGHEKDHVADPGKMVGDLISRQAVLELLRNITRNFFGEIVEESINVERIEALPSAQPEVKEIGYAECANAMLKMWIDNVLTDGEYNRIMDRLNAHYDAERRRAESEEV